MTTTANFQTDILYPGGYGKCGIGTHDPYPDGIPDSGPDPSTGEDSAPIFKINKPLVDVWDLIWNLEEWEAKLSVNVHVDETLDGETTDVLYYEAETKGKFHRLQGSIYKRDDFFDAEGHSITAFVLNEPPHERVCGNGYETIDEDTEHQDGTPPYVAHGRAQYAITLPDIVISAGDADNAEEFSQTVSGNILDPDSNVVGDYSLTRARSYNKADSSSAWEAGARPLYVRILPDNTADIYIMVFTSAFIIGGGTAMSEEGVRLANNNTNDPTTVPGKAESVTITLLGVAVPAYLWVVGSHFDGVMDPEPNLTTFSLTYAVTPTTLYTY